MNKTFNNVQQKLDRLILILKQKISYITIYLHLHTEEVKCLSGYFTVLSNKMYKNKQKYRECRFRAGGSLEGAPTENGLGLGL